MDRKLNGKLKNLYRKMIFGKVLIVLYIVLPMLLVATGFSAWVINTPSFSADFYGTTTSSALIDTSALLEVKKFEPIEELYYTGPVSGNNLQKQLNIDTIININPNKVATIARESSNIMYLKLTLMLKSNKNNSDIFTRFSSSFSVTNTVNGVNVEEVPATLEKPASTSSTYSVIYKLTFTNGTSLPDDFSLTMSPSFVLSPEGYAAFYDYCVKGDIADDPFVLDLRLSESANI